MIFRSFLAALAQIPDPRFRRVLFLGVALTLALLIAFSVAVIWGLQALVGAEVTFPFIGTITWLDNLIGWGSGLLMAALSVVMMVPVASAITSMFLDTVAQAVEDEHYPNLPAAREVPIAEALLDTVNFLGVIIFANLVALIFYLLLTPFAPLIFWCLNGFLLGREYFMLAAMRRIGRAEAKKLRRKHAMTIWLAGTLMAMPLTIPLLNLIIPILGAATFTHLFHALKPRMASG